MGIKLSMIKWKDEKIKPRELEGYVFSSPALFSLNFKYWQNFQDFANLQDDFLPIFSNQRGEKQFNHYIPLHQAALMGDWETADGLLNEDLNLVRAPITLGGETALHLVAIEGHLSFVINLLQRMIDSDLRIPNDSGCTALCFAAVAGHLDIAKLMVQRCANLATIPNRKGATPLYMAALQGHRNMAEYLFALSGFESWTMEKQVALLTTCINSGLYDLAVRIVENRDLLVVTPDDNGETPLEVLVRASKTFCRNGQKRWWRSIANIIPPYMKSMMKATRFDAYELFEFLWKKMICQQDIEAGQTKGIASKLLFMAVESGNDDFVVELIRRYPDFMYETNDSKHSIFHIAVSRRYVQVFNLIYEFNVVKDLITTYIDNDGNNILHLAAKLAPPNQLNCIPGQALQMQREVLWYEEVEKIVQPTYRKMTNSAGQTPYELFLTEHENLMKEGEKMMKQIAKACMLVTMLITTVVFTAAFTVPGGYSNNTGAPILQNEKLFIVFPISEAVATLSSLTSMLMFLSILTSRYTEMDFLNSLPFLLVIGISTLFVSIAAMMAAFCSCVMFYQHGLVAITVLLVFFACVPIMFIILKCPLLVTVLRCSYGGRWLFRSNNRLFTKRLVLEM